MASCELCGEKVSDLTKVKMEGTILKVCDSCTDMGEKVTTRTKKSSKSRKKKKSRIKRTATPADKTLATDYGARVKKAREAKEMTHKELADKLNEKQSRISKIETQNLKPDENLGRKLQKVLDITLYVNSEVSNYNVSNADDRDATLEDVADIKD
ncbi:multiprotein bridging factor aMBF1 [Candidatus Nanohalococcus occultus]|uniref:Transcription factor, MBF1-like n=1 Tax=Candidatus Nanohalococcus occultus TaxID=2978047 RepID=A0ABY8CGG1_9ARCH|nr:Putative transcription factor, MBF1-like [Candidatus Nanohaloarchaeota archaeon SVXNc]